ARRKLQPPVIVADLARGRILRETYVAVSRGGGRSHDASRFGRRRRDLSILLVAARTSKGLFLFFGWLELVPVLGRHKIVRFWRLDVRYDRRNLAVGDVATQIPEDALLLFRRLQTAPVLCRDDLVAHLAHLCPGMGMTGIAKGREAV